MEENLIEFVRAELKKRPVKERNLIADRAKVGKSTAHKIAMGYTENPSYSAVSKLAAELNKTGG